jgi:hypothetical protein
MQDYVCIGVGTATAADIAFINTYAETFGLPVCTTCKADYICVGVGTGQMAAVHTAVLEGYAQSRGFPYETDSF